MTEGRVKRKLTAILAGDVVGFSRLMGKDEAGALTLVTTHLDEVVRPAVDAHQGRIFKTMGDGFLVEFESAVEAVECAAQIQRNMAGRTSNLPEEQRAIFRIGINLGDVIVQGDDVFGDGVNVAARIESLADPGGIFISRDVHNQVRHRIDLSFEDLGDKTLKNIEQKVRIYRANLDGGPVATASAGGIRMKPVAGAAVALAVILIIVGAWWFQWQSSPSGDQAKTVLDTANPVDGATSSLIAPEVIESEHPSVAILPFDNLSGDPEQQYFSDGMTEDLITRLAKMSGIMVIAQNSSFVAKDQFIDVREIGIALGVRFVVEGSVRRSQERLRITAQLIDTKTGQHLWAERYDRDKGDVFAVQDEVVERIVSALSIQLSGDEQEQLTSTATTNFEAYDLFLRGQQQFSRNTEESLTEAAELYRRAIQLDPGYAHAYSALATVRIRQVSSGYSTLPARTSDRALELASQAMAIDPTSPQVQWALGYIYMYRRQFDKALEASERAVSLSPNYADGYALLALIKNNLGQAEDAIRLLKKGMVLNPYYTWDFLYQLGRAYYANAEYDKAIPYLNQAIERNAAMAYPRLFLAASYVELGQMDDAKWEITQLQAFRPHFTLSHLQDTMPIGDKKLRDRIFDNLRSAGLPE